MGLESGYLTIACLIVLIGLGIVGHWKILLVCTLPLLFRQWMQGPKAGTKRRVDGKTVVITGANSGIGKATALGLSKRGAHVVMLCRNVEAGEEVAEEIRENTKGKVTVQQLDLASLVSVRECAEKLRNTLEEINILINNAGIGDCPLMRTKEGFEMQIGTNHFGHFLLTNLVLPQLKKGGPDARVVNLHSQAKIQWDDINWETTPYNSFQAYCQSKLANILFTKELARRLEGSGVNTFVLHPGVVNTNLSRYQKDNYGVFVVLIWSVIRHLLKTCESGASTSIYCSVEESLADHSGRYYSDCKEKQPAVQALNMEDARKLWDLSEKMVGLKQD